MNAMILLDVRPAPLSGIGVVEVIILLVASGILVSMAAGLVWFMRWLKQRERNGTVQTKENLPPPKLP